jgi:hypothetical protein
MKRKKFLKIKNQLKPWFDYYTYLQYNYYLTLFGSLISRGHKIRAFNFLLKVKEVIKHRESKD